VNAAHEFSQTFANRKRYLKVSPIALRGEVVNWGRKGGTMVKQEYPVPSVYRFLDAREFLRGAYEARRKADRTFSQRRIAQALRAGSSSFFRDVLNGKSKLTPSRILGFSRLFRLDAAEAAYFEKLVSYMQADSPEEKQRAFARLKEAETTGRHTLLQASHEEYFSKWHYAAVRELLVIHDFRGDYAALGRMLNPPLTEAVAREAVVLLNRLKLIRKRPHGGYEPTERVVHSGPQNVPAQIKPVLSNHLELAKRALDLMPPAIRPFSYLTVSVSEKSFVRIHEKLRSLRDEVFEIVMRDEDVDRLYQLNFQFFPLSEVVSRRKK
jgi:uncharacterized protein (TIGR02147 family)